MSRPVALLRHRRAALAATVALQLVVLYLPRGVEGPGTLPHLDKVVHAGIFGLVVVAGAWAGVPGRWLVPGLAAHAVLSEVVQGVLLPGRSGDVGDVVADLGGIGLGMLTVRVLRISGPGDLDDLVDARTGHRG